MEHSKYTLVVNKKRISVTKEVYKAYYHCRNREKYLDKLANKNNISLENCIEKGIPVEYMISPVEDTIEEALATKELIVKMLDCLALLDDRDRYLIIELFYHGKSERTLSLEIGVPPMTIHDRKCKILKMLRKLISQ